MPVYRLAATTPASRWRRTLHRLKWLGTVLLAVAGWAHWQAQRNLDAARAELAYWERQLQVLQQQTERSKSPGTPAPPLPVDGQALARHWLQGAQRLQIKVVDTQFGELQPGLLALEGRVSLLGAYPAIKALMIEVAARQPGLVWRQVRLRRAQAPHESGIEAELGFALLRRAVDPVSGP